MNTLYIGLGASSLIGMGLVVGIGAASLLVGAGHWFFGRPKLLILKSKYGKNGLAFGLIFNGSEQNATFDQISIRLYNAFGTPNQWTAVRTFAGRNETFADDVEVGEGLGKCLTGKNFDNAIVEIELTSSRNGISFQFPMKGKKFRDQLEKSTANVEDFTDKHVPKTAKPLFTIPKRTFIAEANPERVSRALKIQGNPDFAGQISAGGAEGAAAGEPVENFNVSKVWIEPGCIVCNACEDIYPEVFEVQAETCITRADYPKDDGLKVAEAAEACPVEIIKFDKA